MTILGGWGKRLTWLLVVLASLVTVVATVEAQQLAGTGGSPFGPMALPPTPPQGAWGEVIMANTRWMVVQNQAGQQFPIANDAVAQFLIRWPTRLDVLTGNSVVEAIGPDQGNNSLLTDHIDIFEGADRDLVQQTYTNLLPNNRPITTIDPTFQRYMNAFDIGAQNLLHGWAYPVQPGINGIPGRIHVVGPVVNIVPLQVGIPGNNFVTVLPNDSMTTTRVTRGNTSYAEKGDLVFLMPLNLTTRTVVLSQAVLYKKMPITEFRLR